MQPNQLKIGARYTHPYALGFVYMAVGFEGSKRGKKLIVVEQPNYPKNYIGCIVHGPKKQRHYWTLFKKIVPSLNP